MGVWVVMLAGSYWERAHLRVRSQTVTLSRLMGKSATAATMVPIPSAGGFSKPSNFDERGSFCGHKLLPLCKLGSKKMTIYVGDRMPCALGGVHESQRREYRIRNAPLWVCSRSRSLP